METASTGHRDDDHRRLRRHHAQDPEGKLIAIAVMLVGFASLIVGAIAQRFIAPTVHEVELADEDLVEQVRDISARLQRLERALQQRRSAG